MTCMDLELCLSEESISPAPGQENITEVAKVTGITPTTGTTPTPAYTFSGIDLGLLLLLLFIAIILIAILK